MGTVISLTETKIRELLGGWEELGLTQEQINALVAQVAANQASVNASMEELNSATLPQLEQALAEGAAAVSDLNDTALPDLQAALEQAQLELTNVKTVDIPFIEEGLAGQAENARLRPWQFAQDEEPPYYDDLEDRYLVVGDSWIDGNKVMRIWNGVEWTTMNVDIPDFSLTVKKLISNRHQIY